MKNLRVIVAVVAAALTSTVWSFAQNERYEYNGLLYNFPSVNAAGQLTSNGSSPATLTWSQGVPSRLIGFTTDTNCPSTWEEFTPARGLYIVGRPAAVTTTNITSSSVANPTVVTSVGHGMQTGQFARIAGHTSTPSINGIHQITRLTADTFTIPVNVTVGGGATGTVEALSPSGQTALTNAEDRTAGLHDHGVTTNTASVSGQHSHTLNESAHAHSGAVQTTNAGIQGGGGYDGISGTNNTSPQTSGIVFPSRSTTVAVNAGSTTATINASSGTAGTNAPYVQLKACRKI